MITFRNREFNAIVRPLGFTLSLSLSALLVACSGGSSSSNNSALQEVANPSPPPTPTTQTLEGTAAIGAPIVDGTVTARCADGSGFTQDIKTEADGTWTGEIDSAALPCALQVSGGTPPVTLHSYAVTAGTINITPLTDLVLALATSQTPQDWFNGFDGGSVDIGTASGTLLDTFSANGFDIPATGNPFTTVFVTDGSGWDGLLDDIGQAIADDPGLADHAALVALVKDGNLGNVPAAPVPVKYSVTGTISGASAAVRWEARKNGAAHNSGSNANGAVTFTLPAGLEQNSAWSVVVSAAPAGQTCSVSNGNGTLKSNISNIAIQCTDKPLIPDTYTISGSVSGATGAVQWQTLAGSNVFHSGSNSNGNVVFTTAAGMDEGSVWSVRVLTPPAGQICAVVNGSGTLAANITNVLVSCRDKVVTPSDAIYDFSSLNLKPALPNLTPIAPTVNAVDPSFDIASLYAKLGEREQARIFAPAPANLKVQFDNYQREYSITQVDPNSSWARKLSLNPGADDELNTADDVIYAYTLYPDGESGISYSFTNPGADGIWFTEDDAPGEHLSGRAVYFPKGVVLEYKDVSEGVILIVPFLETGDDGMLFTADDVVNYNTGYQIAILDGEGNRGQIITYDAYGADKLWLTADDRVKNYVMATSALSGRQIISVLYNSAGPDQNWFSGDDGVSQHTQIQLDSEYLPRYSAVYDLPGIDGTWFTADDRVLAWTYYGYDGDGNAVLVATHSNKGSDGIWFTADDTATGLVSLQDANGRPIVEATISGAGAMGPDGAWLSGDETLSYGYAYTRFDDNGYRTLNAQMQSAGPDGKWFTGDDLPTAAYNYWQYEYDAQGRITRQVRFDAALAPASPAFSEEHIASYTINSPDFSTSVSVYRDNYGSNFGDDGTPFTPDDFIPYPYTVLTQTGYEQFNQSGPDAMWFTGDDIRSGYVVSQYDGNRKTLEQSFDSNDEVLSYSEVMELTANSYRTDQYLVDDTGTAVLIGYNIVVEDGNGYPRNTTWYSTDDVVTNVGYTEYDSRGNITRESAAYSPGNDGVWGTPDDFGTYYLRSFNSDNELTMQFDEYPGSDRIWGTQDDYVVLGDIVLLDYDIDALPGNTGYFSNSCDDLMSVSSGSINVVVRDQNGAPLAGAVAQLNSQGSTATTNASGEASFTGLSGAQDLHLFKDGYAWESFYCVAPGSDVTVQARLASRTEQAISSKVNFQATPGNEYFSLRLLNDQGESISTGAYASGSGSEYGQTYGSLLFAQPTGSEVTGELWALQVDRYGVLTGAQSLGQQTHTTIASNLNTDYQPIELSFDAYTPIPVAAYGTVVGPGNENAQMTVSLGGIYDIPFRYSAPLLGSFASVPDVTEVTLPALAQPTGLKAKSENWQAWYPGDYPELGGDVFLASIITGFQYEPLIQTQQATGDQPVIQWVPARQVKEGAFITVTSLELRSAVDGRGWQPHWTLHVPAGDTSVELPRVPAAISEAPLPQDKYTMVLRSRAIPALDYHSALGTQDLHDLNPAFAAEVLSTGSDFGGASVLLR